MASLSYKKRGQSLKMKIGVIILILVFLALLIITIMQNIEGIKGA